MRCGIPLLGERVAPRCTAADSMLLVSLAGGSVTAQAHVPVTLRTPVDLRGALKRHRIDILICGGVSADEREVLASETVELVDNVACSTGELIPALQRGILRAGYGLTEAPMPEDGSTARKAPAREPAGRATKDARVDCLSCGDPICLSGANCRPDQIGPRSAYPPEVRQVLEAAADVSLESERRLCRLAELVYYCLEMRYRTVGIAYCVDLSEPARVLARVLRRFFDVVSVCCKVGGLPYESPVDEESSTQVACNPVGQAALLNVASTDINVAVGLCIGADTLFARASLAPVTTLFVKDRSLANNPIGALYSEYYLKESLHPSRLPADFSAPHRRDGSGLTRISQGSRRSLGLEEEP